MSRHDRRVVLAVTEWRELGVRGRREVRRYARRGKAHPDPYLAALGHAWATELLRVSEIRPSRAHRALDAGVGFAVLAAIAAVLGPVAAGASFGDGGWADRRLARRLLAVSAPDGPSRSSH